jgi:monoamine oxidase
LNPAYAGDPRSGYGDLLLREEVEGGVHFAGTETENAAGHVDGAVMAGERVAEEIRGERAAAKSRRGERGEFK